MNWHELAERMVADLVARRKLDDPRWRAVFERIPRHVFVPGQPPALAYRALSSLNADPLATRERRSGRRRLSVPPRP